MKEDKLDDEIQQVVTGLLPCRMMCDVCHDKRPGSS